MKIKTLIEILKAHAEESGEVTLSFTDFHGDIICRDIGAVSVKIDSSGFVVEITLEAAE